MKARAILRRAQRGFSLVSAIFLLVVLGALAAFAVRIAVIEGQSVNLALRSAQAFHAASSGVAWAAYRAVTSGWCGSDTLALSEGGTAGFTLDVSCTSTAHTEGADTINVYVIDVLAQSGSYGGAEYVSRRLEVKVTDAG
jgi:MSHA biogenesis protein MshP